MDRSGPSMWINLILQNRRDKNYMTPISLIVGARYARGKKRNRFGSVVAAFSLLGMALGVAALITVLSVMNGFNREIQLRFQTVVPHISLLPKDKNAINSGLELQSLSITDLLTKDPLVDSWSPLIEGFALLSHSESQTPVQLKGISPEQDKDVVPLAQHMLYGSIDDLKAGDYGLVLGSYIARQLYAEVGDRVQLVLPEVQVTPAGLYPRQKQFVVVGVFDSGSQLDAELAYLHIDDAARVLRSDSRDNGWRVKLQSEQMVDEFVRQFEQQPLASDWRIQTWSTNYESLFRAMKMEKVTVGMLLLIIILVAAFNIVSGLVMMVSDKRADMAVLRTIGASTGTVMRVFVVQGLILGIGGIVLGALVGSVLAFNLPAIVGFFERAFSAQLFDPSVFYVSFLPTQWLLSDFIWVISMSLLLTLVATIIPAWQASKITPTEALSYKQ